ncbi:RNA polymerase factor sigma-54 [Desulfococcaceae bacterium HSG8]|nr:RNA polymerase factor sigma-54 [Desulfococcaceae bacterium HSG8]
MVELKQNLKLSQQLVMTPQLQMAIKLLQLSRLELVDTIRQELEENPALEEVQDSLDASEYENPADDVSVEKEVTIEEKIHDGIDWRDYIEEYNSPGKASFEIEGKDAPKFESFISHKESLSDHLFWQLSMTSATEEEKRIGTIIIGNLNKNGYVDIPMEELARVNGYSPEKVADVLALLQTFDPIGICARDLAECLLIQMRRVGIGDSLATDIIADHLNHLENRNYSAICKALKVSMKEVISAVNMIKELDPRPGRKFSDEAPQYIEPDIFVHKLEDEFVVVLNDDGMPRLCINAFYRSAFNGGKEFSEGAKEYVQEKLNSATWLIKSIHQRQKTIYKVMESILKFQKEFFEKGLTHLKPMVLKDVAEDIDMHESTISRVTTNKYAYTPLGIFELKYFFNSSISRMHGGGSLASASVQERIKQLIGNEDSKKPYSDEKISKILKESNINIARRTVAKYRETLRILPSNKRRQP